MSIPFGTGANPRPTMKGEFSLGLAHAGAPIPAVYKPDYSHIPVKMQGTFGTCGAHAGSALVSFLSGQDLSPKYVWSHIVQTTPEAETIGTDQAAVFAALHINGDCHETLLPNTLPSTIQEYSDINQITQPIIDDAAPFGTGTPAYTNFPTMAQIKSAIFNNKVVMAMVKCGTGWYTNTSGIETYAALDILPLRLGDYLSGHMIILWGYDENFIYFRNSWGTTWGQNGDGWFDSSYLPNVVEIGAAVEVPSTSQQIISDYEKVISILEEEIALLKNKI
jgi:hypothetical protein